MVAECAGQLPVPFSIFLVRPTGKRPNFRIAFDALTRDPTRVVAILVCRHLCAQGDIDRLELLGSANDRAKRGRHDDNFHPGPTKFFHSSASLGAKSVLTSDNLVVKKTQVLIDIGLGQAFEGGENLPSNPRFALGQMKLVGQTPQSNLAHHALAKQIVAPKVANQQNGRIALNGGAVEVEGRESMLARGIRSLLSCASRLRNLGVYLFVQPARRRKPVASFFAHAEKRSLFVRCHRKRASQPNMRANIHASYSVNCELYSVAYAPFSASSWACVPCSTMSP